MLYDAIIIGAGAAGLMAACSASQCGKKVLVLESNDKPGLKILISGGGRCNFTNLNIDAQNYVSKNPHFCKSALNQFTQNDFISMVKSADIPYYEKTLGQLFCKHSSKQVLSMLLQTAVKQGVQIKTNVKIETVSKSLHSIHDLPCVIPADSSLRGAQRRGNPGFPIDSGLPRSLRSLAMTNINNDTAEQPRFTITTTAQDYNCKNIIIATGGLSYPQLGASDFGYRLAKEFGHNITTLTPALDGLVFSNKEKNCFEGLAGISLNASVHVEKTSFTENILFTHVGLSGPAILKASLFWQKGKPIKIDFMPQISDFPNWAEGIQSQQPKKLLSTVLATQFSIRLVTAILNMIHVKDKQIANTSKEDWQKLKQALKDFTFTPKSTVGYKKAEVTRGGIDTKDISSKTLESKLVPGLFFVGEVVDVTGLLGGYNFQWAWSSGWAAGQNLI